MIVNETPELPYHLQTAALCFCWMAMFYFWSLYSGVNYRGHYVGRAIWNLCSSLLFMFTIILITRFFSFPGEAWWRVGAYWVLAGSCSNLAYSLWRQQRSAKFILPEAHS